MADGEDLLEDMGNIYAWLSFEIVVRRGHARDRYSVDPHL